VEGQERIYVSFFIALNHFSINQPTPPQTPLLGIHPGQVQRKKAPSFTSIFHVHVKFSFISSMMMKITTINTPVAVKKYMNNYVLSSVGCILEFL